MSTMYQEPDWRKLTLEMTMKILGSISRQDKKIAKEIFNIYKR